MSRMHLLEISQRVNTFKLYEKFKSKNAKYRINVRLFLKILKRLRISLQKDIWILILNYLPNNQSENFGQIIDIIPDKMSKELLLEYLQNTLEKETVFLRNPLLFTANPDDKFRSGEMIWYGPETYICYPSLYISAVYIEPTNNGTVYKFKPKGLFFGVLPNGFGGSPFPTDGSVTINGGKIKEAKEIMLFTRYLKNGEEPRNIQTVRLLYFPEHGITLNEEIVITVPKKRKPVQFAFAFGVCSPTLKAFFMNKRIRTT